RQLAAQLSQRVDHLETLNQRLNHELAVRRRPPIAPPPAPRKAHHHKKRGEMIEAAQPPHAGERGNARPHPPP
ncbi:IS66 family transposase, partial [Pseudomonas aeruginosa]